MKEKEGKGEEKEGQGKSGTRVPLGERENEGEMGVKLEQPEKVEKEQIFEEDYDQLNGYFEAF